MQLAALERAALLVMARFSPEVVILAAAARFSLEVVILAVAAAAVRPAPAALVN